MRLAEQCAKLEVAQHEQISTAEAPQDPRKKRRPKNRAGERVNMVMSALAGDKSAAEKEPEAGVTSRKRRRKAPLIVTIE